MILQSMAYGSGVLPLKRENEGYWQVTDDTILNTETVMFCSSTWDKKNKLMWGDQNLSITVMCKSVVDCILMLGKDVKTMKGIKTT